MKKYLKYYFLLILITVACKEKEDAYTNKVLQTEFAKQIKFYEDNIYIHRYSFESHIKLFINDKFYYDVYHLFLGKTERLCDTVKKLSLSAYSKESFLTEYTKLSNDLISYGNTFVNQPQNKRAFLQEDLAKLIFTKINYTEFAQHYSLELLKQCIIKDIREYECNLFYITSATGCRRKSYDAYPFVNDFNLSILQKSDSCFISVNEAEIVNKITTNYKLRFNSLSKVVKLDTIPILTTYYYFAQEIGRFKLPPLKLTAGKYKLDINIVVLTVEDKVSYPTSFIFDVK